MRLLIPPAASLGTFKSYTIANNLLGRAAGIGAAMRSKELKQEYEESSTNHDKLCEYVPRGVRKAVLCVEGMTRCRFCFTIQLLLGKILIDCVQLVVLDETVAN